MKNYALKAIPFILAASLLTGCGGNTTPQTDSPNRTEQPSAQSQSGNAKTGLSISTSVAKSTDASTDAAGLAQADSIIIGVIVDKDGKIVDCAIDAAQTKVNFDTSGQITTPLDTELKTKNELGAEYGMDKASSIGKEWNEQAAALAKYVIGKTAEQVMGIAVDAEQHATDADLKASVTISIGSFIDGIVKAVDNAANLGANVSDKINLGTITSISKSKSAGEENGQVDISSTYTAVTTDSSGKITSCAIDATQAKVDFDASGKLLSDIQAEVQTKNEIGENYGLKAKSSIKKEWNEQAAAFAKYVVGKTASEVQNIAVNEDGSATDADLTASVTIGIEDFKSIIAKAVK